MLVRFQVFVRENKHIIQTGCRCVQRVQRVQPGTHRLNSDGYVMCQVSYHVIPACKRHVTVVGLEWYSLFTTFTLVFLFSRRLPQYKSIPGLR